MKKWKELTKEQKKHVLLDIGIILAALALLFLVAFVGHIVEGIING